MISGSVAVPRLQAGWEIEGEEGWRARIIPGVLYPFTWNSLEFSVLKNKGGVHISPIIYLAKPARWRFLLSILATHPACNVPGFTQAKSDQIYIHIDESARFCPASVMRLFWLRRVGGVDPPLLLVDMSLHMQMLVAHCT